MNLYEAAWIWSIKKKKEIKDYFMDISLPVGINKDTLISLLMLNCCNMDIIIPNSQCFKMEMEAFFYSNLYKYTTLQNTTTLTYNPLEDYSTNTNAVTDKNYHKDNTGTQINKTEGTEKGDVSAFNELDDTYTNSDRNRVDMTVNRTDDFNEQYGGTDVLEEGKHGITRDTYQELVLQERQVADFNIYNLILEDFKMNLLVSIY